MWIQLSEANEHQDFYNKKKYRHLKIEKFGVYSVLIQENSVASFEKKRSSKN